jgi:hypothetical protein
MDMTPSMVMHNVTASLVELTVALVSASMFPVNAATVMDNKIMPPHK